MAIATTTTTTTIDLKLKASNARRQLGAALFLGVVALAEQAQNDGSGGEGVAAAPLVELGGAAENAGGQGGLRILELPR